MLTIKERIAREQEVIREAKANRARLTKLQSLAHRTETLSPGEAWPSDPELADRTQDDANAWVRQGVARLAAASKTEHVVLMAATHADGKVGVASSLKCESMAAMNALGAVVAEVNRSFVRDGVKARVSLRMRLADDPLLTK